MIITINTSLKITNISKSERDTLKDLSSFDNPEWLEAVKYGRYARNIPKKIKLFTDLGKEGILLPRGCIYKVINAIGAPDDVIDETVYFPKQHVNSRIKLRDLQIPWVNDLLKFRHGIGVAPAGSGKTVCGLHVIAELGQPTLWLTHRNNLMDQLKERAGFFIDAGTIGTIGGGKFKLGDLITVGLIQTVSRRDMEEYSKHFGLVIVDEVQIVPAVQARKSISKFSPRWLYGLTATPYREDGLEQIIFDTIGPQIAVMDREEIVEDKGIMPAKIRVRTTGVKYVPGQDFTFADVIDWLVDHPARNAFILQDVLAEIALGNTCIILTSRIKHGAVFKEALSLLNIPCIHVHSNQSSKKNREGIRKFVAGEAPIIIATYSLLGEGFDHQPSNRIFFALPIKARSLIEQSKGRIERVVEDKVDAIVYDYVDDILMLLYQFKKRLNYYRNHNLQVET